MEKLLHERLREFASGEVFTKDLARMMNVDQSGKTIGKAFTESIVSIADEIEHYYIPRPRYEDGEPVQFGDEFVIDRYMIEPETLKHIGIFSKEQLEEWEQYRGVSPVYELNFHRPGCDDGKEPIIKRPTLKVLDADSVEIKVGETLYRITTGEPVTVEALENVKYMEVLDAKGDSWNAQSLTHERPVFDVNDERICKGDTVWDKETGERLTVVSPCSYTKDGTFVTCKDGAPGKLWYKPEALTHREPDSLEKLRDDLYTLAARDDGDIEVEIVIFADRLTALIEIGTSVWVMPHE